MSSDNLLAGLAGFAQGFEKGFLPMVQNRQKMTLEEQLAQLQAKRDLEAKRTLATEQFGRDEQLQKEKSGLDLSRETTLQTQKSASDLAGKKAQFGFDVDIQGKKSALDLAREKEIESMKEKAKQEEDAKKIGKSNMKGSQIISLFPELLGKIDANQDYDEKLVKDYVANKKVGIFQRIGGAASNFMSGFSMPGSNSKQAPQKATSPKPGGVLHADKDGNKAWVYPDGTFDEVK